MAGAGETARTTYMKSKYAQAITNGMPLITPTIRCILVGPDRSGKGKTWESWRNVEWGGASGQSYIWLVQKEQGTATMDSGNLVQRSFAETCPDAQATVSYYNIEETWALAMRDRQLNKRDETQIANIQGRRMVLAKNAVYRRLAQMPHAQNETSQPGGLGLMSPTNVGTSTSYAGISMVSTNTHWTPGNTDYATLTIAANAWTILDTLKRAVTTTAESSGGGARETPDCCAWNETSWAHLMTFMETNFSHTFQSGTMPRNINLVEDGFENVVMNGVTHFWDENFGLTNGYVDGAAAEECQMFHSKHCHLATHATKAEGFIQEYRKTEKDDPAVRGDVGVFGTGMITFYVDSPIYAGLAFT